MAKKAVALSARLRLAEVMGALGHFVEHGADVLPFSVEILELHHGDVARVEGVI